MGGDFSPSRSPSPACSSPFNRRRGSYRALVGSALPTGSGAAGFFCDALLEEEPHHFLDSCFLCGQSLAGNRDIFMYRGDTPFCSEECRQEQIDIDEAVEKTTTKNSKQKHRKSSAVASPADSQKIHARAAGTAVAAG